MVDMMERPGDRRAFVHKRLLRGAVGLVTGGPLAATTAFLAPVRRRAPAPMAMSIGAPGPRRPAPRSMTARPSPASAAGKQQGRLAKFQSVLSGISGCRPGMFRNPATGGCDWPHQIASGLVGGTSIVAKPSGPCPPLMKKDPHTGECKFFLGTRPGPDPNGGAPGGDAVMGQYGAGLAPGSMPVDRAVCLRGMVLGNDGICYNRTQIRNRDRMWPRGRRPLLTGGDMRAISTAARAGRRLEGATKRLQKIGLMKKPPPRRKQITSGPTEHHHH